MILLQYSRYGIGTILLVSNHPQQPGDYLPVAILIVKVATRKQYAGLLCASSSSCSYAVIEVGERLDRYACTTAGGSIHLPTSNKCRLRECGPEGFYGNNVLLID